MPKTRPRPGKPMSNHSPANTRPIQREACGKPQPSKGKTKTAVKADPHYILAYNPHLLTIIVSKFLTPSENDIKTISVIVVYYLLSV